VKHTATNSCKKGRGAIINDSEKIRVRSRGFKRYIWVLTVVWTVVAVASLVWSVIQARQNTLEAARIQARAAFEKDVIYRRWNSEHGGVYASVTEETQPNPYLNVSERNVMTPLGKPLTLINPAYMTRQVHELAEKKYGVRGHITSLNPIRPQNVSDPWETEALQAFEQGKIEGSSIEKIEGKEYMRLMRPLITEKGCLKCHAAQGYKRGDIRGGISVSVPMEPLWAILRMHLFTLVLGHVLLWLMGLAGIVMGTQRLRRSERERNRAADALQKAHYELERRIEERTAELAKANAILKTEIAERKWAEETLKNYSEGLEEMVKERTHELEAAQDELVKHEKLSVLGQLTATVSHELRNPLAVIRSSSFYVESKLSDVDEKITKHLKRIEEQVGLCDSIIGDLFEYTRGRRSDMLEGELNPFLEEVLDGMTFPEPVQILREMAPDLPMVRFDRKKLQRVVNNLVTNAIQAVVVRQEGWKNEERSYQPQVKLATSVVDNGVSIEVEDNGTGMDEETAARVFEPLFTTRARGTGLGLAIVKKIVDEHGGSISLQSELDRGTKAIVAIPVQG